MEEVLFYGSDEPIKKIRIVHSPGRIIDYHPALRVIR